MSLSDHVRTLGRGPGRSRPLTSEEARDAMSLMLSGEAAPEAIGALLMLLRVKGETAEEIAGLSISAQADLAGGAGANLNWPSYAAGWTRGGAVVFAGRAAGGHGWAQGAGAWLERAIGARAQGVGGGGSWGGGHPWGGACGVGPGRHRLSAA